MILLDANSMIALMVDGRTDEANSVLNALREAGESGEEVIVTESVLVEVCWVMERSYRVLRQEVAQQATDMLSAPPVRAWNPQLAEDALHLMREIPALSLTDSLLVCRAQRDDAAVLTFDRGLRGALEGRG